MAVYKRGSKGTEVERIQERLRAMGCYKGPVDGDFGAMTEEAVKAFQKLKELAVDGRVGAMTWKALFEAPQASLAIDRSMRLDNKDYIMAETQKDLIVLHHTVGGSASSTINYWKTDPERIATAYVVERDGLVYEVFDPRCWAFHLGLKGSAGAVDKRSIGIEIASEGGLVERDGRLYCFGKVSDRTLFTQEYYDNGVPWRGFRYFDAYSDAQVSSVIGLINMLCEQFKVPRSAPASHLETDDEYRQFAGILGHYHLRPDKSDVHPGFPWQKVIDGCSLALT